MKKARVMNCHSCQKDLTATKQLQERDMGARGMRTFNSLKAPYRVEVVITIPREGIVRYVFCEACKDIPNDAMAFIQFQRNERSKDPNAQRASKDSFSPLKLASA